jgi:hypothetical protein
MILLPDAITELLIVNLEGGRMKLVQLPHTHGTSRRTIQQNKTTPATLPPSRRTGNAQIVTGGPSCNGIAPSTALSDSWYGPPGQWREAEQRFRAVKRRRAALCGPPSPPIFVVFSCTTLSRTARGTWPGGCQHAQWQDLQHVHCA